MPRFLEMLDLSAAPASLSVRVGDVLVLGASGGDVREGGAAVELWGPLVTGVVGTDGAVHEPAGPPNTVVVRAVAVGTATLELFTGDPFHAPRPRTLRLRVAP